MQINALATTSGSSVFYDQGFRIVIESHIPYLLRLPELRVLAVDPFDSYKYEGDLFGLLDKLLVPKQYHYAIMLANRFSCPADLKATTKSLLIPPFGELDLLGNIYQNKKNSF
jgi:hypothetical protein